MGASVNVGKLFGVRIQIHWTFLLIIAWAVYQGWVQGGDAVTVLLTVALVLAIFICVVLHELGHSLAARNFGIATRKITLLPIGGVASLERMPEDPKQELLVAAAGPAVNLVIAGFLFLFVHSRFRELGDAEAARQFFEKVSAANFLTYLFMTNVMLVAFNAIPAFPMDGGRVLRALLSFKMDRVRATQIAVKVGQLFAIFFFSWVSFTIHCSYSSGCSSISEPPANSLWSST